MPENAAAFLEEGTTPSAEDVLGGEGKPSAEDFLTAPQSAESFLETEPRSTYEKTVQAAAGAAARSVATMGTGLERLEDIGRPTLKQRFAQHEAAMIQAGAQQIPYSQALSQVEAEREGMRQRLMMPGATVADAAGEAAQASEQAAAATPGNPWMAKAGELAGGMLPLLLTGPAAPAAGGLSSAGATYQQALDYYRKQGFSDERAKELADHVAATTGLTTGELFLAMPGFGKAAAEKLMANRLAQANPIVRAAVNTLAASAQGSLVMGADSLSRNAQAKLSYRPELTWEQALTEAARDAMAGAAGTALVHAPMEAARLLAGAKGGAPTAAAAEPTMSEFGGDTEPEEDTAKDPRAKLFPLTVAAEERVQTSEPKAEDEATPESPPTTPTGPAAEENVPSRILQKQLREAMDAREPIPAEWLKQLDVVPDALPEGYRAEGDRYTYTEPAKKLTPEQQAARDNAQAMEDLRQIKAEDFIEDPDWSVDEPVRPTERVEPGTPMDFGDRPPDILDYLENHFTRVRPTSKADYGDYVRAARGRAKEMLSMERGENADRVLQQLHAAGMYPGIETEDQLLDAMVRAGDARIGWRESMARAKDYAEGIDKTTAAGLVSEYSVEPEAAKQILQEGETPYQPELSFASAQGADVGRPSAAARPGRSSELAREALKTLTPEALKAAFERTKKVSSIRGEKTPSGIPQYRVNGTAIHSPADFARTLISLRSPYAESLKVVILDKNNVVNHSEVMYAGTLDTTVIDGRDLVRLYQKYGHGKGTKILISHNHPSGDVTPSEADLKMTRKLKALASAVGFDLVDHVITNGDEFFSIGQHDVIPLEAKALAPWENMPRKELQKVDDPVLFQRVVASLRQANPDTAHIIYLNTRLKVSAIERMQLNGTEAGMEPKLIKTVLQGVGTEGAMGVAIDFGPKFPSHLAVQLARKVKQLLATGTTTQLTDFSADTIASGRTDGFLAYEPTTPYQETETGGVLRETPTRPATRPDLDERETGVKIQASPAISDPTKQAITEYLYQRRSNATDDDMAAGIVRQHGLESAIATLRNPPANMPAAVHSRLLGTVTQMLAEQERAARQGQDFAAADALAQKAGALWDEMLPRITELAQGLQALNDLVELSPDAQVARARQRLERAADEEVQRHADEVTQMQQAVENGRAAGVEDVRKDPEVNGAARAAVDEAVANNGEVNKAVIMDLAGPWSESPHIVRMARDQVRAKAEEILGKGHLPQGLSAPEHLRQIMDDLAKRAATIAAGFFQGASQHAQGLKGLFIERLGLDDARAGKLAKEMEREFDKQVTAARAKLPKRIATARVARERQAAGALPQGAEASTAAVDAAIRQQLKILNQKLGEVLRREADRRDATGAHVAERVVQASGLQGEKADTLRTVLENRWNSLVTQAQVRALEGLQKRTGVKMTRPYRNAFDKLVELDRLGALTSSRFYDAVKNALNLKRLTDADAKELRRLVGRAQEQPEGFLRQRAAADVLKFTEQLSGNRRWWDIPMAIFYNNILSGLTTPAKIAFENTNMLVGNTLVNWLSRPGELKDPLGYARAVAGAYKRGLAKGALQAADTLKTGVVSGVWAQPKPPSVMEMQPFGPKFEPLNFWKYFGRVIGTSHELTFKPAWEVKQTLIARDVARREGLRGQAAKKRVADLMGNMDERFAAARAQALKELPTGSASDIGRRTREIIEQQREANMPGVTDSARDFALRTAYLNEPYGFMGKIAIAVRTLLEQLRREHPWLGTGVKSQIPFTTIVANILNEKLNWTPVGLARALASRRTGELYGRPMLDRNERAELYAKSIVGTIALGALGELFGHLVHGNGPSDPHKRKQMQAAGWIPHSIELGGKYYSYMNTPLALGLSIIGNYKDWMRYGKGDEADALARAAFVTKGTANAIVSQGMLDGVKRLFEALGSESTSEGGDRLQKLAARTGSSFIFPSILQQADRMFDPTQYDQTGVKSLLQSQVPFARRLGRPVLNILGEPVQQGPFHYWASKQSADPVWRLIVDKGAFISAPNKSQVLTWDVGQAKLRPVTDDEYYEFVKQSGPQIRKYITDNLERLQAEDPELVKRELRMAGEGFHKGARFTVTE